jgi:hypothetical protein
MPDYLGAFPCPYCQRPMYPTKLFGAPPFIQFWDRYSCGWQVCPVLFAAMGDAVMGQRLLVADMHLRGWHALAGDGRSLGEVFDGPA